MRSTRSPTTCAGWGRGPRTGLARDPHPGSAAGLFDHARQGQPGGARGVCQVVAQVIGNDAAVAFGGAAGNLELNVMLPVMGRNLLSRSGFYAKHSHGCSPTDLRGRGWWPNVERCRGNTPSPLPVDRDAPQPATSAMKRRREELAKPSPNARPSGSLNVLERGYVEQGKITAEQLDAALDVLSMTHP